MKSCTVRDTYGDSSRVRRCNLWETYVVLTIKDQDGTSHKNVHTPAQARKLFKAGLVMCDEIEAEQKEKK